ncbi:Maf family protein [Roseixanthobacter glucoisosaccharinicivorans]|uniref:Maf family protein n=1 Tax=Roseixanthobacter glucoisosaccharinicivorans TaxID=3119923 RepID=UPI00372628F8
MTLWCGPSPLVLASRSATRRALLEAAGLPVELVDGEVDERAIETAAPACEAGADDVARMLARAKAFAGARKLDADRLVIGADQTLALGGAVFHKPKDRASARAQLARLAGRTHALHSAVAVVQNEEVVFETVQTARLTLRTLSDTALDAYLDAAGPAVLTSVGGYQLEGLGVNLFAAIEGDHFTILGLPLLPLLGFLRDEGVLL